MLPIRVQKPNGGENLKATCLKKNPSLLPFGTPSKKSEHNKNNSKG
jgi:hypothetical protein